MVFSGVLSSDSMLSCVLVQKLVVKPDQLIKRRGKLGLVGINLDLPGVQDWVKSRLMKETMVSSNHTSAGSQQFKCFSRSFPITLPGKHRTSCSKLVWFRIS